MYAIKGVILYNVQLHFGIAQLVIWQPPVGTINESNIIVESHDLCAI